MQRRRSRLAKKAICLALAGSAVASAGQKLVWNDEFDGGRGTRPDSRKWTYDLGAGGWGNQESERYTDLAENASLDGHGHLVIRAIRNADGSITSARLKTQGLFSTTYGRIAARIKIPGAPSADPLTLQGVWPAFWMLGADVQEAGWPRCGEIDVMENIGKEPRLIHGTVHGPGYSGGQGISAKASLPREAAFGNAFHVYAVDWSPNHIAFLLDGKRYAEVSPSTLPSGATWVFDHPFFLLLNLAIGGAWPGNPDSHTHFPQELVIDWVRVSKTNR